MYGAVTRTVGRAGLYARVPLLARAHKLRTNACKALAAAKAAGPESAAQVRGLLASSPQTRQPRGILTAMDTAVLPSLRLRFSGIYRLLLAWHILAPTS